MPEPGAWLFQTSNRRLMDRKNYFSNIQNNLVRRILSNASNDTVVINTRIANASNDTYATNMALSCVPNQKHTNYFIPSLDKNQCEEICFWSDSTDGEICKSYSINIYADFFVGCVLHLTHDSSLYNSWRHIIGKHHWTIFELNVTNEIFLGKKHLFEWNIKVQEKLGTAKQPTRRILTADHLTRGVFCISPMCVCTIHTYTPV